MRRPCSLLALACCLPVLLRADGLSDLITNLKRLDAKELVRLKIDEDSTESEDGKDRHEQRSVQLEDGPAGTRVLQDSASGSAKKVKHDVQMGSEKAKGDSSWRRQVRAHQDLLEELDRAKLLEDRPDVLDGQPMRRLRLSLDLDLDEDARKHVKQASHEAILWLGPDGLPVAMQRDLEIRVRALAFIHVWTKISSWNRFKRVQDRLISTEARDTVEGKAMGRAFSAREITLCAVQP
jgi:hypothetical protein